MNRIAELRKEIGMSQSDLAKKLNIHQTAVSQWESGKTAPRREMIEAMCMIFDVSVRYLLGTSDNRKPYTVVPSDGTVPQQKQLLSLTESQIKSIATAFTKIMPDITKMNVQYRESLARFEESLEIWPPAEAIEFVDEIAEATYHEKKDIQKYAKRLKTLRDPDKKDPLA